MSHALRDLAGDADTIILVPGLDGTALFFYRQIPLLSQRFNVVSFPLPNESDRTMDDLVEELRSLVEEVSVRGAILLGESFGGALSLSFGLAYPELTRGLVIVNSFARVPQRAQLWIAPKLLRCMPWGAMHSVRRFTQARLHSPHTLAEDLAQFHEFSRSIGREGYIRRLEILWHYDLREKLPSLAAPALFLGGSHDQLLPSVEQARFMASVTPRGEHQVLNGYGHICLINHDLDLLEYVGPWWDRIGSRDP